MEKARLIRFLKEYKKRDKEIDKLVARKGRAYERALCMRQAPDDMPKSPERRDRAQDAMNEYMDLEKQIDIKIDELAPDRNKLKRMIALLPDQIQQEIMTLYFLRGKEWEEVAKAVHYCERCVYRFKSAALEYWTRAIDDFDAV